ncbi:hypothetical protein [Paraglaciecola sp. MB-3u-78]|uniref:hypothetical protein n=1 Tax=Paraglaciecola sp. MB-3u-78 TaxID=2058332 RepID=UPI000C34344F|nr:hypothetical protein [Paraglaciecola sp. MB-3u-78]PKH00876.1 hypothetical protein CXF95_01275 [Paraglaciecola sp. MB-3u-78]
MQLSLESYINTNFGGNKSAFARHMQINSQQVSKWIKKDWIVNENTLYSPKRDIPHFLIAFNGFESTYRFPLYIKEDIRNAWIVLNIHNGAVYAEDGHCEMWDSAPKLKLYFGVCKELTNKEVHKVIDDHLPVFQAILSGSSIENVNGTLYGRFTKDAESWMHELDEDLLQVESDESPYIIDHVDDYLENDPLGEVFNASCIEDVTKHIVLKVEESGCEMSDLLSVYLESSIMEYYEYLSQNDEICEDMPRWFLELVE